jgi:hypothetical protein
MKKGGEAPIGFEPMHKGFADLSLSHLGTAPLTIETHYNQKNGRRRTRETGSPGGERPFFPKVRARALTVTPTDEPVTFTIALSKKVNKAFGRNVSQNTNLKGEAGR